MSIEVDVIIIGAGVVGLTLAHALKKVRPSSTVLAVLLTVLTWHRLVCPISSWKGTQVWTHGEMGGV